MAGIGAVTEGLENGTWYLCTDGRVLEPLDIVGLLFPNKGRSTSEYNQCFVPRHIAFPPLRALLPARTEYFVPDDLIDSIMTLVLLCVLVAVGIVVCKSLWERVDPSFAAINPSHKKWYVVANLSKAFFLAVMAVGRRFWVAVYLRFVLDKFDTLIMKRFCIAYTVTDFVALFMVPKLPRSTIIHHVTTTLMCLLLSAVDMTVKGWGGLLGASKMCVLYGMFSTVAFPVNIYLALRVVYPDAKWQRGLVNVSLWTYVACCAGNWTIHAVWLAGLIINWEISIAPILYLLPLAAMMNDDIVLIKWLRKKSSPMASEPIQEKVD